MPDQEFGLDVALRVGHLRYCEHRSRAEIHQQLLHEGVMLGERSVSSLLNQYDLLLSLSLETLPERAASSCKQSRRCRFWWLQCYPTDSTAFAWRPPRSYLACLTN